MDGESAATAMPDGFGPYRFVRLLGEGAMAKTYLVQDARFGVLRVAKIGAPNLDEFGRHRFQAEVSALQQLNQPNIPLLVDVGELPDGRPFLVTKWVEGQDLRTILEARTRTTLQDVLAVSRAVAMALGCAHELGILHLDVKPSNILVPRPFGDYFNFDQALLLDFGVSDRLQKETGLTRAGYVLGTPYYMSPEQVRGEAIGPSADIFSLGVVMYEMLTGEKPFDEPSVERMFYALLYHQPKPFESSIPSPLADLVWRCLEKNPNKRPASGSEMVSLIDAVAKASVFVSYTTALGVLPPTTSPSRLGGDFTQMFSIPAPSASGVSPPAAAVPRKTFSRWVPLAAAIVGVAS